MIHHVLCAWSVSSGWRPIAEPKVSANDLLKLPERMNGR